LIRSPAWIALEVRELPRAALARLAETGHIRPVPDAQLIRAEAVFRERRAAAETTLHETSHVEDLTAILEALELGSAIPPDLIAETVAWLHRRCLAAVELMADVPEMLQALRRLRLRLGIVSNAAYAPFLHWALERFGLLRYFEDVVVSADVAARKPGLEIFRIALARLGLSGRAAVYVGDDFVKDVRAPKQLAMRAIWYHPDGGGPPPGEVVRPDAVVSGHRQIPSLAEQWLAWGT
jgi:HAD superfamily hydrolase (TIGR01509 family)